LDIFVNNKDNLVMAFQAGTVNNFIPKEEEPQASLPVLELDKEDIAILLNMIKDAHFKGEHIQKVYELIIKLQECYSKLP
jgi:hypothetical protein